MALLASLKKIVKESGGVKKAEDLERNIFKIFVKVYTLICCGVINAEEFLSADKPVREAFELLVRIYNGRDRVKAEKISEALRKVESLFKRAEEILIQLLSPYLSTKNMLRVSLIFSSLMDIKFLETVLRDASLEADLVKLVSSMEVYTQVQMRMRLIDDKVIENCLFFVFLFRRFYANWYKRRYRNVMVGG